MSDAETDVPEEDGSAGSCLQNIGSVCHTYDMSISSAGSILSFRGDGYAPSATSLRFEPTSEIAMWLDFRKICHAWGGWRLPGIAAMYSIYSVVMPEQLQTPNPSGANQTFGLLWVDHELQTCAVTALKVLREKIERQTNHGCDGKGLGGCGVQTALQVMLRPVSATCGLDAAVGGVVEDKVTGSSLTIAPGSLMRADGSP
eukprot:490976-Amphidinium_carterae.2